MSNSILPEILALDSERCLARFRGLLVQWWHDTRAEAVVETTEIVRRIHREDPNSFANLIVVAPDSPLPDAAARRELDVLSDGILTRCVCSAYVHQGTGFGAAAVRGIMIAITMPSAARVPRKICSSVSDGLAFLAPMLDEARFGSAIDRARAVGEIEARFAGRPRA